MNNIKRIVKKPISLVKKCMELNKHKRFINNDKRLFFADNIKTHLTSQEKRELYSLSHRFHKKCVAVEIGSYIGSSSCFITAGFIDKESVLYCVDTWNNDAMTEGNIDTFSDFKKNTVEFQDYIKMIKGLSYNVVTEVESLTGGEVDFLFIDGDHSYNGVKKDWDFYSPFLKKGAIVAFHDVGWAEGVQKVIKDDVIEKVSDYKMLPNLWWGIIK